MDLVVADASPLILMAKLALLETVCSILDVRITPAVLLEATRRKDLPDARSIRRLHEKNLICVSDVDKAAVIRWQRRWGLGKGEASVFALLEAAEGVLLVDDYVAISVARALGYRYISTPVLVYELCRRNVISRATARGKILALREYAWIGREVLDAVMSRIDKE